MAVKKNKKTLFADVLETVTKYFLILVIIVVLFILFSGIRVVESGQVAIVLRFGEIVGDNYDEQIHEPGLLFTFPYFVDEVIIVPKEQVLEQMVMTHYTSGGNLQGAYGGYLITGDRNVALVAASVKYRITDAVSYALRVNDIPAIVDGVISSGMVSLGAGMDVDNLLTVDKLRFATSVTDYATERLDVMDVGVEIISLELTQVAMPDEVRDVYENVNSARLQANTIIERAEQYKTTLLPQTEADADTLISKAETEKAQAITNANTELAEFWGVLEEYQKDKEGVQSRLYHERLKQFFANIGKVYGVQNDETQLIVPSS